MADGNHCALQHWQSAAQRIHPEINERVRIPVERYPKRALYTVAEP